MQDLPQFDRAKALTYLLVGAVVVVVGISALRGGDSSEVAVESAGGGGMPRVVSSPLTVDVSGSVAKPGVYTLPRGSRVIDAIQRAGGATRAGDPGGINRAALLSDGQQVVVPVRGQAAGGGSGEGQAAQVSLGTATQTDLEGIDGIGPVTAQRIIEFRETQGGLSSVDDLDQISGIGPVTMESLRAALQP